MATLNKNKCAWLIGILTVAVILRILVALPGISAAPTPFFRPDSPGYVQPALALVEDGRMNTFPGSGVLSFGRAPGFTVFLSGIFSLFGVDYRIPIVLLALISAFTCVPVLLTGRLLGGTAAGLVAAALFALNITAIANSPMYLSDTLFAFLVAWQLYFFVLFVRRKKLVYIGACLAVAAVATLVRPIGLAWIFPALFLIFIIPKYALLKKFAAAGIALAVFFMILTPWMYRNHRLGAGYCIDTNTGAMLHQNGAFLLAKVNGTGYLYEQRKILAELEKEFSDREKYPDARSKVDYRLEKFKKLIAKYPVTYFSMHFRPEVLLPDAPTFCEVLGYTKSDRGTLAVLHKDGLFAAVSHYFAGHMWLILILLPLIGVAGLTYAACLFQLGRWLWKKKIFMFFFFLAFVEYFLFLPGPVMVPRYHLPTLPLMTIMAGCGLVFAFSRIKKRLLKQTPPGTPAASQ